MRCAGVFSSRRFPLRVISHLLIFRGSVMSHGVARLEQAAVISSHRLPGVHVVMIDAWGLQPIDLIAAPGILESSHG